MRHIRAVARISLILIFTVVLLSVWTIGRIVMFWSTRSVQIFRRWMVQSWSRSVCRIMGIAISQEGRAPSIPFCLVSNHLSYVDVLILQATSLCVLVSRADVKGWPLIGLLASQAGTLFIDRKRARDVIRIGNLIESTIQAGNGVTFFPEGTSTSGRDVGRFNSSLLEYPARDNFPVHYAAISYTTNNEDPPASDAICWWGSMSFSPHAYDMLGLKGFDARIVYGKHPVMASDRKILAAGLHDHVKKIFHPTD